MNSYISSLESLEFDNSDTTICVRTKTSKPLNGGDELGVDAHTPTEAQPEVPDQLPAEPRLGTYSVEIPTTRSENDSRNLCV